MLHVLQDSSLPLRQTQAGRPMIQAWPSSCRLYAPYALSAFAGPCTCKCYVRSSRASLFARGGALRCCPVYVSNSSATRLAAVKNATRLAKRFLLRLKQWYRARWCASTASSLRKEFREVSDSRILSRLHRWLMLIIVQCTSDSHEHRYCQRTSTLCYRSVGVVKAHSGYPKCIGFSSER